MTTGKTGQRVPECALVCNLPRPGDEPALLQHSDVETFFHEFGHLIHHIFAGGSRWAGISGIATEWDFVEAPSQLLEEWVRDAATLATFAVHHETGEPLPAEMVAKLRAAEEFGKGLFVRQQMFYATLSLELYRRDPAGLDPVAVEREAQERLTPYRHVDGTYLHLGFGHLDGYSAIYCTYMWSLVIAKDLFTVFAREGLLDPPRPRTATAHACWPRAARPPPPTWSATSSAARTTSPPTRPGSTPDPPTPADHEVSVELIAFWADKLHGQHPRGGQGSTRWPLPMTTMPVGDGEPCPGPVRGRRRSRCPRARSRSCRGWRCGPPRAGRCRRPP